MRSGLPASFRSVVIAAEALGLEREPLVRALGMRWDDVASYDVRVPYAAFVALWDEILRQSGDPLIGARLAREIIARGEAALFAYTLRTAPTVGEGWQRLVPLVGLLFGEDFELVDRTGDDGRRELGYRLPIHVDPPIAPSEECIVLAFVEQCRAIAPAFRPDEICFQHAATADAEAWRRAIDIPVRFDADFYGVRVGERALHAEVRGHDPSLAGLLEQLARPLVTAPAPPPGPADGAIRVIRDLVDRRAEVTVAAVAKALHVSTRTLQRQLAAAGTSVRAEHDRVRHEVAVRLLRESRFTIAEIADRLGFADPSQLTRAVKRWTGAAPSALRRQG